MPKICLGGGDRDFEAVRGRAVKTEQKYEKRRQNQLHAVRARQG